MVSKQTSNANTLENKMVHEDVSILMHQI